MKILKILVLLGLVMGSFSCSKENVNNEISEVEEPQIIAKRFLPSLHPQVPKIAPNTMQVVIAIIVIENEVPICEKIHDTVVKVVVKRIVNTGGSIVNRLAVGAERLFSLNKQLVKDVAILQNLSTPNTEYMFTVVENPCMDFDTTRYEIVDFESLE